MGEITRESGVNHKRKEVEVVWAGDAKIGALHRKEDD